MKECKGENAVGGGPSGPPDHHLPLRIQTQGLQIREPTIRLSPDATARLGDSLIHAWGPFLRVGAHSDFFRALCSSLEFLESYWSLPPAVASDWV